MYSGIKNQSTSFEGESSATKLHSVFPALGIVPLSNQVKKEREMVRMKAGRKEEIKEEGRDGERKD